MEDHVILGVHITNRAQHAVDVQKVLTDFGCNIKTRIGLHEAAGDKCSSAGLIVLEVTGGTGKADEISGKLTAIEGVEVKKIVFSH